MVIMTSAEHGHHDMDNRMVRTGLGPVSNANEDPSRVGSRNQRVAGMEPNVKELPCGCGTRMLALGMGNRPAGQVCHCHGSCIVKTPGGR